MIAKKTTRQKSKSNKIGDILYYVLMIVMVCMIIFIIQTKAMGNEPGIVGHRLYTVDSGSMSPTIKQGALIIVQQVEPSEIKVGDIISYYGNGTSVVTHRAREVISNGESFTTRGDANDSDDALQVDGSKLIGKVVFHIGLIGYILKFLGTAYGVVGLIAILTVSLIISKIKSKAVSK